jgi:hypothetical protein
MTGAKSGSQRHGNCPLTDRLEDAVADEFGKNNGENSDAALQSRGAPHLLRGRLLTLIRS